MGQSLAVPLVTASSGRVTPALENLHNTEFAEERNFGNDHIVNSLLNVVLLADKVGRGLPVGAKFDETVLGKD